MEKKNKSSNSDINTIKLCIYLILCALPIWILISFIHEMGHIIAIQSFSGKINGISINLFPFGEFSNSWVRHESSSEEYSFYQLIFINMMGSLFTLIWGYIFLMLFYAFKKNDFLRHFFLTNGTCLMFEITSYIIGDFFFFHSGDWYEIYKLDLKLILFFLIISAINIYVFIRMWKIYVKASDQNSWNNLVYSNNQENKEIKEDKGNKDDRVYEDVLAKWNSIKKEMGFEELEAFISKMYEMQQIECLD